MNRTLTTLLYLGWFTFLYAVSPTRTLPVVYVSIDNNLTPSDKETQLPASVYIDSILPEFPASGSATSPIRATIKGRGNWTWNGFDKKPYKIKFDKKQNILGMPQNRHWNLMACADDWLGFLKMPAGFAISKAVGLRWTPRMQPVELVMNGQYMGLYFLTEHVRIGTHRVNIQEQENYETQSDSITGGWLVEIDNYQSEGNVAFQEGNGQYVMVSLHEPDTLSAEQRNYLHDQLNTLNNALYDHNAALPAILDIREAAKFYLVQEIMEDCESYHGSCYLYKDRDSLGIADPWKFGPVWDFGNAYDRHAERWIYDGPTWPQYWIAQLATWPEFQTAVKEEWWIYCHTMTDSVRTEIQEMAARIEAAARNDAKVWRNTANYRDNSDMASRLNDLLNRYDWRLNWLHAQWGEGIRPLTWDTETTDANEQLATKILRNGQILIRRGGHTYNLQGCLAQ